MKTITGTLFRFVAGCAFAFALSQFTPRVFAVEGLKVAVPSTNVVLSWPSASSETYIVQYRHTLSATDTWATLADYYPADGSTNITFFTDTNIDYGVAGSGGGSGSGSIQFSLMRSGSSESLTSWETILEMLMPPTSGKTISRQQNFSDSPVPMDAGGSTNSSNGIPGTGFYRVVRNGIHLIGVTNNMVLSGVVQIPIELGNTGGKVSTICITENDTPIGDSTQISPLSNPHMLTFNSALLTNGVHEIGGFARWDDTNGYVWEADSPAISVTISNEISFENWIPAFGETGNRFLFRATSAHTDTDWIVYVYGSNTNYLGYFYGHTYDGDIYFYYDYSGTFLTNNTSFIFEIATEYVDPPTPKTYKQVDPWTAEGEWAMAAQHAWDNASDSSTLYQELNGFVGVAGFIGGVSPTPSDDGSPYALAYGASNPAGDANWSAFRNAIFNQTTRNLVYFGHGEQAGLGYDDTTTNRFISSTEIANRLHTIPAGQTNRHAFRFVFVDACSTALGTMPESFGILHRENVPGGDYVDAALRFSAYVGWPKDKNIGILYGAYINYDHVKFIQWIQHEMISNGRGIKDAIRHASHYPDTHGSFGEESMKVFGYWDLTVGGYNN